MHPSVQVSERPLEPAIRVPRDCPQTCKLCPIGFRPTYHGPPPSWQCPRHNSPSDGMPTRVGYENYDGIT